MTHRPVRQVFDQFVAELHLLSEAQIVALFHHHTNQLAQLRLDQKSQNRGVQTPNVSDDGQHHLLNAGVAEILWRRVLLQHVFHDENNVFDKLSVGVVDDDLAG